MNIAQALGSVNRDGVSYKIGAVTGWDAFWYFVLSRRQFATHVAVKLRRAGRYVDQFQLPDGSWWDKYGSKLEENK